MENTIQDHRGTNNSSKSHHSKMPSKPIIPTILISGPDKELVECKSYQPGNSADSRGSAVDKASAAKKETSGCLTPGSLTPKCPSGLNSSRAMRPPPDRK